MEEVTGGELKVAEGVAQGGLVGPRGVCKQAKEQRCGAAPLRGYF